MSKSKSILSIVLLPCLVLAVAFLFAACGHEHQAVEEWSSDATSHWHACVDETCTEQLDKANHTFGEWSTKTAATCVDDEVEHRTCSVCGYEQTRPGDQQATGQHTIINITDGHKCEVCGKVFNHEAAVDAEWQSNGTSHWKECKYDDCTAKVKEAGHDFGVWTTKTAGTCLVETVEHRFCEVCNYEETRTGQLGNHNYVDHICSVCGDLDESVVATITNGSEINAYTSIEDAISNALENSTITIVKDIILDNYIELRKPLTLDLGGNTITGTAGVIDLYADLMIENGTLHSTEGWVIWTQNNADLTIASDAIISTESLLEGKPAICVTQGGTLDVYGTITSLTDSAISGLGNTGDGDVVINIYNGAVVTSTNRAAIYMPNTNQLNIMGGTITGKAAVYAKAGTTTISGGELNATSEKEDFIHTGNGYYVTGDVVIVEACGYPGGNPTLVITGGEFSKSANDAHNLGYYTYENNVATITVPQDFDCNVNFTISQTVKADAEAIIDGIIADVYNNSTDLGTKTTYSVAEIQEIIADFNYYVEVGTVANFGEINTISFNGISFTSDQEFYLSIGNSNQLLDKAYYVQDGKLYVAGPIVTFEAVEHSTIKINGMEFDFDISEPTTEIEFTNVRFNNGAVSTAEKDSNTEYTLNIKSGTEYAGLYYEDAQANDVIITKRLLNGELNGYGIVQPVNGTDGYCSYLYAVGWVEDFSQVNIEKFDGAVYDYSVYIASQDKIANVTLNINVVTETETTPTE